MYFKGISNVVSSPSSGKPEVPSDSTSVTSSSCSSTVVDDSDSLLLGPTKSILSAVPRKPRSRVRSFSSPAYTGKAAANQVSFWETMTSVDESTPADTSSCVPRRRSSSISFKAKSNNDGTTMDMGSLVSENKALDMSMFAFQKH